MEEHQGLVLSLTATDLPAAFKERALRDFAYGFGWIPSDSIDEPSLSAFANGHLIVEHGLETSAVLTFLRRPYRFVELGTGERKRLFSLSYNNLVDWHIQVESDAVTFVYNRAEQPLVVESSRFTDNRYDLLRREAFEKITEKRPTSNLPALDDALIKTISTWKRMLSAEMGYGISNESLSALFNAIIFVRATEDHYRFRARLRLEPIRQTDAQALLNSWLSREHRTLQELFTGELHRLVKKGIPSFLIDSERLKEFDSLNRDTVAAMLSDFYRNKYLSYYDYDFSVISKHALSRIYESYVSILRLADSPQASLFPELPTEERDRAFGSVYTPQYVARFFSRYLRQRIPPGRFRLLNICDPACGSGIFLRTMLEMQSEPVDGCFDEALTKKLFERVQGVDIDKNAAHASRLSLALLHLVLTDSLPEALDIRDEEAIEFFGRRQDLVGNFDVVFANPPFVAIEGQTPEMRARISEFLGEYAKGRIDTYIPFLLIALRLLRAGGFGCFVLPHSFLVSKNAEPIRELIAQSATISCVVDLSAIRVFGDVGSYVVLLIFQKNELYAVDPGAATVVRCQDFPGQALQDAVDDRSVENKFYSVYKVDQSTFQAKEWELSSPAEVRLRRKLNVSSTLNDFLVIRQGIITGADEVFLRAATEVPLEERGLYLPLLRDRDMRSYVVPGDSDILVFYPFLEERRVHEAVLSADFPETWRYLAENRERLEGRKGLARYRRAWWEPMWPRSPQELLRSKLVSPHLVLVPKFSWDVQGKFAVSRSPFMYAREVGAERDILRYFLGVLNSSVAFWYLTSRAHVYRKGYLMLEPKTLSALPVPDPGKVDPASLLELLDLVDRRLIASSEGSFEIGQKIDVLVASMYGMSRNEMQVLGFS